MCCRLSKYSDLKRYWHRGQVFIYPLVFTNNNILIHHKLPLGSPCSLVLEVFKDLTRDLSHTEFKSYSLVCASICLIVRWIWINLSMLSINSDHTICHNHRTIVHYAAALLGSLQVDPRVGFPGVCFRSGPTSWTLYWALHLIPVLIVAVAFITPIIFYCILCIQYKFF